MSVSAKGSHFLDSMEYEEFVKTTYEALLSQHMGSVYLKKTYPGRRTGHRHEIDVSIELTLADLAILILVECKYYRNKVGISDLLEFAQRIDDISAHKGVLVTTVGFQEGAIRVASAHRIALVKTVPQWHTVMPSVLPIRDTSLEVEPAHVNKSTKSQADPLKERGSHTSSHTTVERIDTPITWSMEADLPSAWREIMEALTYESIRDLARSKALRLQLRCHVCGVVLKDFYFGVCTGCFSRIDESQFKDRVWYKCPCGRMLHISDMNHWVAKCECGRSIGHLKLTEIEEEEIRGIVRRIFPVKRA